MFTAVSDHSGIWTQSNRNMVWPCSFCFSH